VGVSVSFVSSAFLTCQISGKATVIARITLEVAQ